MRSLRKARSGFLALKSEMRRRSCILTPNDVSNSSPFLAEQPTIEQGPSISQASTAEDHDFGTRIHRLRCQHPPPCRTETCHGKAWKPRGDLPSLLEYRGTTTRIRRPHFPVPVSNQLEPFMKENIPNRVNHGHSNGLASQSNISVPASNPSNLLGSIVAVSPSSCSLSVKSINSQYSGPVSLKYIRGRFYRSIDPHLIGTEHSDDHGVTDCSDTTSSLPNTAQANAVLDIPLGVKNRVSVPATPSDRVHRTNAVPQPRGRSPLRRLFGIESHVSTPLSDRFDSVAHRIRSGNLKVPSDLPKSRSSIASSRTSYASKHRTSCTSDASKHRSSRGGDSLRLSLHIPSMVLRIDLSTILSWGRAESTDPS